MAANMLPIIALGAAALLVMKKKGNGGNENVCPEGEVQTGTKRDGTIICGPPTTHSSPLPEKPSGRSARLATGEEPSGRPTRLATGNSDVTPPAPEDPYAGQPWTAWPQPVQISSAYVCRLGHVLVRRDMNGDGTIGESRGNFTWCVPPWGAVLRAERLSRYSSGDCEPGLTAVIVDHDDEMRNACRNIPSA